MKKAFLLIMVLAVMASSASAEGIRFGAKVGLSMANVTDVPEEFGDDIENTMRMGMIGGLFACVPLGENLSLQPELLYAMKGSTFEAEGEDITGKFDYIELPVLIKFNIPMEGNFKPCIFAGPSVGMNVRAKGEASMMGMSVDIDFKDATNTMDFGIVGGAGFGWAVGTGMLTFDARYEMGLTKVIKGGDVEISAMGYTETEELGEADSKNYNFAFMFGYAF